jgi:hypothetical protein
MFGARLAARSDKDVIAERVLQRWTPRGARPLAVRIARPEEDARDATTWSCRVEFLGIPGCRRVLRHAFGVDQVQALLLAFELVQIELAALRRAGMQLLWMDQPDLGFATTVSAPPSPGRRGRAKKALSPSRKKGRSR